MYNVALVTGASSGIGRELARVHASHKGDLILVARREEALEELKEELVRDYGVQVLNIPKDLSKPESAEEIYDEVTRRDINVDVLINNAGKGGHGFFHEREWAEDAAMIQLNILSLVALTHGFLPAMIDRNRGRILNVASSAALAPGGPLQAIYFATKAFVLSFSKGLAGELTGRNVTVTALCPGATKTEFGASADLEDTKLFSEAKFTPEEVAQEGYQAMLEGKLMQTSALERGTKLGLQLSPLIPDRLLLRQIRKLQEAPRDLSL